MDQTTNTPDPGVHYPHGIAGGTHPGGLANCPHDPCVQRRIDKAGRDAADQAQLDAFAEQARAVRARHDAIIRRRALLSAATAVRFSANLRDAEGETGLAAYGRELADLIAPPTNNQTTNRETAPARPRRFHLQRTTDITGVSGTGRVADGVQWPDGTVSIRWRGDRPSTVFWDRLEDAEQVHGHGGHTRIVWDDEPLAARLARIAQAHTKQVDSHGGTDGYCVECDETWPCPTWTWASTDRDADATWDPADDEPPPACPAGLLSLNEDVPPERCIVEGAHQQHVSTIGSRWTNPDDGASR